MRFRIEPNLPARSNLLRAIIGITGGIGAGKSTVLGILSEMGLATLDCDRVVHGFYTAGHPVNDALAAHWGKTICDEGGAVRRRDVAERVFADSRELVWLNRLIHPEVKHAILARAGEGEGFLFCAIPLLFEVDWQASMQATWAVWCDPATQKRRLTARGWSESEIACRLDRQIGMDDKLRRADFGLVNTGGRRFLRMQIVRLLETMTPADGAEASS